MSTDLITEKQPIDLRFVLTKSKFAVRLQETLGDKTPQFVSSVLSVAQGFAKPCSPQSIAEAAMIAATLDLPVNKNLGFAWIVPYSGEAQFQMGYKGYIQLALRTGQYQRMNARVINADAFKGFDEVGEPVIAWEEVDDSKTAAGYAFAWKLVNGFSKVCYWSKDRVEEHAKRYSQAYRKKRKDSPWCEHFDAMALKTVISNELRRWGIMTVEMQRAFEADQAVVNDEGLLRYVDNPRQSPSATSNNTEEAVKRLAGNGQSKQRDVKPEQRAVADTRLQPQAPTTLDWCGDLSTALEACQSSADSIDAFEKVRKEFEKRVPSTDERGFDALHAAVDAAVDAWTMARQTRSSTDKGQGELSLSGQANHKTK